MRNIPSRSARHQRRSENHSGYTMKQIVYVDHEQLAHIRKQALDDEVMGIDPGLYWKYQYPAATDIEFVVGRPEERRGDEHG
jgi:hypothetical protein